MKKSIVVLLLSISALFACPNADKCDGTCQYKVDAPKMCPKKENCHSMDKAGCDCAVKCACEGKEKCDCGDDCSCEKCQQKKEL